MRINLRLQCAAWGTAVSLLVASAAPATPAHAANAKMPSRLVSIQMDLDFAPHVRSSLGRLKGYNPVEAHVHVGDRIQFVNVDDQVHTATGMAYNGNTAPMNYKFQSDYTQQRGHVIDASEWSTGSVPAHGRSVVFVTKRPGNYFYACGYHISLGQIGVIVVVP